MLEIYPTRLLNNLQIQHILGHWRTKPSFVKRKSLHKTTIQYAMTGAFFRCCIPRPLHEMVCEIGRRHFASSMIRVTYNVGEVLPQAPEGPWVLGRRFRCIVPLTEWSPAQGCTVFANHPEVAWLAPGRLLAISGNERSKELANAASTSRVFLFIHITSLGSSGKL